jgi:hypothetical protein
VSREIAGEGFRLERVSREIAAQVSGKNVTAVTFQVAFGAMEGASP